MRPRINRTVVSLAIALGFTIALTAVLCGAVAQALPGDHLWKDWVSTSGVYEDEEAIAVEIAPGGYPVIVGSAVQTAGGDRDIRYRSYMPTSSIDRWAGAALPWNGPGGGDDTAAGVVIDKAGAIYVAGTATMPGGGTDIVVLKVDPVTGLPAAAPWPRFYDGPGTDDEAEAIARDVGGNVYVTGGSQRADGSWDMVTVKYRPNGTRAWVKRHNNGGTRFDRGLAIAVQGSSVYVAGTSRRPGRGDDVVLIKYTTGGKRLWVRYYDDPLRRSETVTAIACHGTSVYLCGAGRFTAVKPGQAMLIKYSSNGALRWVRFAGQKGGDDIWMDVAVDSRARVHVTGTFFRTGTAGDITTSVYRTDGRRQWRAYFSSSGNRHDTGTALAVDAARRTYVCGNIENATGTTDMIVLCYGPAGVASQWYSRYPDPLAYPSGASAETDSGDDRANDIALVNGALYVVGASTVAHPAAPPGPAGQSLDFQTVKMER